MAKNNNKAGVLSMPTCSCRYCPLASHWGTWAPTTGYPSWMVVWALSLWCSQWVLGRSGSSGKHLQVKQSYYTYIMSRKVADLYDITYNYSAWTAVFSQFASVQSLKHSKYIAFIRSFIAIIRSLTGSVTVFRWCTSWSPGSCSLLSPIIHTPTMSSRAMTLKQGEDQVKIFQVICPQFQFTPQVYPQNVWKCLPAVICTVHYRHTEVHKLQQQDIPLDWLSGHRLCGADSES